MDDGLLGRPEEDQDYEVISHEIVSFADSKMNVG